MNWTHRIAPDILRRIAIWDARYPGLGALIVQRFEEELVVNPDACLGGMIVPTTNRSYYMTFPGSPGLPEHLRVFFAVRRDDAARTLDIVGARLSTTP